MKNKKSMQSLFVETAELADRDNAPKSEHRDKLIEEVGELFQAYNKQTGNKKKKPGETDQDVKSNILEEGADILQILFVLMHLEGFTLKDLKRQLTKNNKKWSENYLELAK